MKTQLSFEEELYQFFLKNRKKWSIEQLSDRFNCGVGKLREAITKLSAEGKNFSITQNAIEIATQIPKHDPLIIDQRHLTGKKIRFGFVTDNHLGSKYERLDVLNALYKIFKQAEVTTVYNAGNVIDGEARFNKFDIHKQGVEDQCKYFAKVYPKILGIDTHFITGDDHEGWYVQREGIEIGKFMENKAREVGRTDLHYLGHMEHDIVLKAKKGEAVLRIVHPGGGSAYAISYTTQKMIESYSPGEKPHILLIGHYHKAEMLYYRGVYAIQGGCTMDQSPFMRKKRLAAHVGGWIVEYQQAPTGAIARLRAEWIPFYDRQYYDKPWQYQW